jgi:trans-aconitate methyltransferase
MSPLTASALDRYAETYYLNRDEVADLPIEELQQERSLDRLMPHLDGASSVLELGFGTGLVTAGLLDRGVPVEVVEGSPLLAAQARERHPGLRVHEALFEDFRPAAPVDAVLAAHVLEHVDDPRALAAHLAGWLAPGGVLIAVVPNAQSLHRRLAVRMGLQPHLHSLSARDELVGHQRVYDLAGLGADLEAAGLTVTAQSGWFLKVVPNAMMLDWPEGLLDALTAISEELDPALLANIAVVARKED